MVVSDHGAGPLHGVVNLNAWLAAEGFLTYATGGGVAGRKLVGDALELRRYLPERLRYCAKQRLPGLRERAIERSDYTVLDWSKTQAFAYGTFGNIVLNVRGREEHGIVEPGEEYERVRDAIAARLLELAGPNGERIVAQAHRREELFHGPELAKVPDLLVEFDRLRLARQGQPQDPLGVDLGHDRDRGRQATTPTSAAIATRGSSSSPGPAVTQGAHVQRRARGRRPDDPLPLGEADPGRPRGPRPRRGAPARSCSTPGRPRTTTPPRRSSQPERAELEEEGAVEVERRLRGLGYLE